MDILNFIFSALKQGVIYAPLALGAFIAFNVLKISDLTLDGSFVFGMTVCAVITIKGFPVLAIFAGMAAGALAGLVTGLLQTKLKINRLLSGILTMTALYTVNFAVLGGQANKYLQAIDPETKIPRTSATVFDPFRLLFRSLLGAGEGAPRNVSMLVNNLAPFVLCAIVTVVTVTALALFFKTKTGLSVRAVGDNEDMVRSSSINSDKMRIIGLMISNALVALSGSMLCQQQSFADLTSGTGMLIAGLAAVIVGQAVFGAASGRMTGSLIAAIAGSVIYWIIIQLAYRIDMPSYFVKAISALIVVISLSVPTIREKLGLLKVRRGSGKGAKNELES